MKANRLIAFICSLVIAGSSAGVSAFAEGVGDTAPGSAVRAAAADGEQTEAVRITKAYTYNYAYMRYTGSKLRPSVRLTYRGETLMLGRDYTISYGANVRIGTGTYTVTGLGRFYGERTVTFKILPPLLKAPAGLTCTQADSSSFKVTWNKVSGADGYEMEYFDNEKNAWVSIKEPGKYSTSCKISSGLFKSGASCEIRLRAFYNDNGKRVYGDWSTVSAATEPGEVTGIKETNAGETGYTLSWNAVAGATEYEVKRWSASSRRYVTVGTVKSTSFTVKDRTAGQKDTYTVQANKAIAGSSAVLQGKATEFKAVAACRVVQNIQAKALYDTAYLTWDPAANADGYEVYYTDSNGNDPVTVKTVGSSVLSMTIDTLPKDRGCKLKVKAIATNGSTTVKSKYPAGVKVRVFEKQDLNGLLDSYSNSRALTISNAHGYSVPAAMANRLYSALTQPSGTVSFAMLDMHSGTLLASNGKTYLPTASTVKMPFMLYALHEMEDGYPTMDTTMTYTAQDYCSGSGIIQTYRYGTVMTNREIFQTIFDYSDNIGLYMLQREFGISGYNRFIASLGCRISMSYYNRWGYVCAADSCKEWLKMYDYFSTGRYGSFMRSSMASTCSSLVREELGEKYRVYSKCGWTANCNHDTTIVCAEHPYVLIIFTSWASDDRIKEIARAADAIHDDMWRYFEK